MSQYDRETKAIEEALEDAAVDLSVSLEEYLAFLEDIADTVRIQIETTRDDIRRRDAEEGL